MWGWKPDRNKYQTASRSWGILFTARMPSLWQKHGRAGQAGLLQKYFPELYYCRLSFVSISKCCRWDGPAGSAVASAIARSSCVGRAPRSPFCRGCCGCSLRLQSGLKSSGMARGGCELSSECVYLFSDTGFPLDLHLVPANCPWTSVFQYIWN